MPPLNKGNQMSKIKKHIAIIDDGLFQSYAEMFTKYFEKVSYFAPWQESDNALANHMKGQGLPGVTRIDYLHEAEDDIDIFYFTDLNYADWQADLRAKGKQVWGLGWAEEYECDRRLFYDYLKECKMPVTPYDEIDGLHNLRKYAEVRKKEGFIKASRYRANWESYHHTTPEMTLEYIDYQLSKMGARGNFMEFVCEDMIPDAREVGIDFVTCNGVPLPIASFGIEIKNKMYLGKIMPIKDMPDKIQNTFDVLNPLFKKYGSKGSVSSENRVNKEGVNYFIDLCARTGNPPGTCLQIAYTNWGEIVDGVTQGKVVEPIPRYKYICEAHVFSDFCLNWKTKVTYPEKYAEFIRMKQYYILDGSREKIPVPGYNIVASCAGGGDTPDEAIEMVKELLKMVECNEVETAEKFMADAVHEAETLKDYQLGSPFVFAKKD